MDSMGLFNDTKIITFARATLIVLMVYLAVLAIGTLKGMQFIGSGVPASNTISVSGKGEVFAVPDTAEFSATVTETAADVKTAQNAAAKKSNALIAYVKNAGVDEKDIQMTDYNISPQYEYRQASSCSGGYCPPGKQVLSGYQVSETLSVKVRDTTKAGDILSGVGGKGASSVSGLHLTIDDQKKLEGDARQKAIDEAKGKAAELAKSLGVSLVRIVGFDENGNTPVFYAKAESRTMSLDSAAPAPEIATGQNKITSNVTLTYEIR